MTITIQHSTGSPAGKLADAELHFGTEDGILAGAKLIGFGIWERRVGFGRNVTFPARAYTVNGERRTFSLVRPTTADDASLSTLRDAILAAYDVASVREVAS